MNEEFNNLVNLYKSMTTQEKKDALIKEFKVSLGAIEKLNKDIGNEHELLINREILDVDKKDVTENDYLEAYFVYLHMINDSILTFAQKISDQFFENV